MTKVKFTKQIVELRRVGEGREAIVAYHGPAALSIVKAGDFKAAGVYQ
jgi:hypothetical protein